MLNHRLSTLFLEEVGRDPDVLLAGGTMLSCEPSFLANEEGHELTEIPDTEDSKEEKDLLWNSWCKSMGAMDRTLSSFNKETSEGNRENEVEAGSGDVKSKAKEDSTAIGSLNWECTVLAVPNHKTPSSERNGVKCRKRKMSGSDNVAKKVG
uniref:Uncharacterized protein n=1 Tax=Tanacetum cinerariifolium TaxID=118510 RepID=A0A6L2MRP7_TANCI|nr:hypothetical protein [Tanacetum cinerariifolium]